MNHMHHDVCCPKKAIKLNHSLNHLKENFCILIPISLKFVPKGPFGTNSPVHWCIYASLGSLYLNSLRPRCPLIQIMACRLFSAKPLSEPVPVYGSFDS